VTAARVFDVVRDAGNPDEISGADVVVVPAENSDDWGEVIRVRAPNSIVVVVGESPEAICETTLFPRARIIGVSSAKEAAVVVDAVVNDLDKEVEGVVRCEGERGIEGEFARVPVRVGAGGVRAILES
jgi:malate/lactate dehydrogenase